MKKILFLLSAALLMIACGKKTEVTSPDGRTSITFALTEVGEPTYSVAKDGKAVLLPSKMGFVLENADFNEGFSLLRTSSSSFDETWTQTWGEERTARDHGNELVVELSHESGKQLNIYFRAYNDGIAFRYEIVSLGRMAGDENIVILDESTEYQFAEEPEAWSIPWQTSYYEGLWTKAPISEKDTLCSPITLEMADGTYGFLHEAALADYPAENFVCGQAGRVGTYLTPWMASDHAAVPGGVAQAGVKAYVTSPFKTPWRMLVLADNLTDLLASRLMLNLNEPCAIADADEWIRPMKFIGIWWGMHLRMWTWRMSPIHGATTDNMKRYLDFAADHNIGGVLAEGWNLGWEGYEGVNNDRFSFVTPYADYDMDYLANYAHERGVEIVFHHETSGRADEYEADLDTAYQYMQHYGMHSVKTGYVSPIIRTVDGRQHNRSQSGVRHYRKVIETAAKYHICIDNHEPVMPTGLQRTYPNLFTQEGIRGQEWNAWGQDGGAPCSHVCTLPYTRFLAGPADYTPGVFHFENPIIPGTRVHSTLMNQLALFVCFYSPLQMACDLPESYMEHPDAFKFIEDVPCDWQASRLLDGKIGEFMVMARQDRHSDNWYLGAITDESARDITVDCAFLGEGDYEAVIYRDGDNAEWKNAPYDYVIERQAITASSQLPIRLASGGGCAIEFLKK